MCKISLHFYDLVVAEQYISCMCAPVVNQIRRNYGTATEKLAFECNKSFCGATKNLCQQNPCMASGITFVTILYCTIYCLLHQEFRTVCAYP